MKTHSRRSRVDSDIRFEDACAPLDAALRGPLRQDLVGELSRAKTLGQALRGLAGAMRANRWQVGARSFDLDRIVTQYDRRTRQDGFHVLHDWDGQAGRVNEETIVIDVLRFLIDRRGDEAPDPTALAILCDYYFMYVLALLSLRIWDRGDPNRNLDRVDGLLAALQGPTGSGHRFADNAETLMLIATSHYEPDDSAYARLLTRARSLDATHQVRVGLVHAASMGCHLRFGFEATYGRDTINMRDDNGADYPWLCYGLARASQEYARLTAAAAADGVERETLVEALANGLSPDARAFVGAHPPASLGAHEQDRSRLCADLDAHRDTLLDAFERHRPSEREYSPLAFFYNFSQNVVKGTIVDALLRGKPWAVGLNDLLTGVGQSPAASQDKLRLATVLMGYARASPDRIRGRLMPVIVYDPQAGRQAFSVMMRKLRV